MSALSPATRAVRTYFGALATERKLRSLPPTLSFADAFALVQTLGEGDSAIAANQKADEILWLLDLLAADPPRTVLEIGLDRGGTLFLWTRVATPDAVLVSVDLRRIQGRLGRRSPFARVRYALARSSQRIGLLGGADSHDEATVERVRELLEGREVDFLFIDGDHRYESVARDFELYEPLVRHGGLVAFHDISPHTTPDTVGSATFWQELEGSGRTEAKIADGAPGYGLGIYRVDRAARR